MADTNIPREMFLHSQIVMSKKTKEYLLVIPVINEGERIRSQLMKMMKLDLPVDVLVTDGGSTDGSVAPEALYKLGVSALIVLWDNGKLSAQLQLAFLFALEHKYRGVITIDGNGKDHLDGIEVIAEKLSLGYDFVQGSRFIKGGLSINTPYLRTLGIRLIHAPLMSLGAGHRFTDTTNGFRGFSSNFLGDSKVALFRRIFKGYEIMAYMPIAAGRNSFLITEAPVSREYPRNTPTPTKINGVRGYLNILHVLFRAVFGKFNP
jgi:glycosyltransferase involved in cell wall biosynthesis